MSVIDQILSPSTIKLPSKGALSSSTTADQPTACISFVPLVLLSMVSAVLVPSRMLLSRGAPDDNSVFAYIGWAMKHGLMPYRDIWDHKGPLLYYLQYAGMSLTSTSTFGIGLIELFTLSAALFFLYRVITSFASRFVTLAIAALSVVFVTHFFAGGNMTESWALLPLAGAHYACWRWSRRMSDDFYATVVGACFTCIVWLRPNMGAYPVVALLVLLYASKKSQGTVKAISQLGLACAAAMALSGLILLPLYYHGVFHDFISAYFGYNAAYSGALSFSSRVMHTRQLLTLLFAMGIAILGVAGWTLGLKERKQIDAMAGGLPSLYLRTLLCSLPLEIAGATLSGRDYSHYLLPLFTTLVVLAAWFLSEFEMQVRATPRKPALLMALLLGLCPLCLAVYCDDFSNSLAPAQSEYLAVTQFIQKATTDKDRIIVLGGTEAAYVTFLSRRLPASRFVYQFALIDAANPAAADQRQQFMCELAANRPAVIVSLTPLLRILCASRLNCAPTKNEPAVWGYSYQPALLPKLMKNFVESQYRPVQDSRFGDAEVLVRNDVAVPSRW